MQYTLQKTDYTLTHGLYPGDTVKLIFASDNGTEGMWVLVKAITENEGFMGTLDNDPVVIDAQYGDEVRFKREHVIDVMTPARANQLMQEFEDNLAISRVSH